MTGKICLSAPDVGELEQDYVLAASGPPPSFRPARGANAVVGAGTGVVRDVAAATAVKGVPAR